MKTKFYKQFIENDYITEKELADIFQTQYNDIFHNILKDGKSRIMMLLQEQVYLHLKIINKVADFSLIQGLFQKFLDKFSKDKATISDIYKIISNNPKQNIYLDYLNCFIHCVKCKKALHKCGNNFVVYKDYVFCLSCKEVYNEFQVHMYCKECKKEYYTKLREIKKESQAYIFPIAYEKYHCPYLGCEEKIKCNKCKSDLYVDIHSDKNRGKINEVFCEKCKSTYNSTNINNICLNCKSNFKSDIKIYNFFPSIKIDLITVVHCLFDRKFALPLIMENKICRCDLSKIEMIRHNDGGDLLEGERLNIKVIICNKCFGIFNLDNFDWKCPKCKRGFKVKKINVYNYKEKEINNLNDKNKNYNNNNNILSNSVGLKEINNIITPLSQKSTKNKQKINIHYNKYCSTNFSNKRIDNKNRKINYSNIGNNNIINNDNNNNVSYNNNNNNISINESDKRYSKISKSVCYLDKILKNEINKNPIIESKNKINNSYFSRNEINNNSNYKRNIENNNIKVSSKKKISPPKFQRTKINIKKIDISDKSNINNTLYNNYNNNINYKIKNEKKIDEIKKRIFNGKNDNNKEIKEIRKNFSVTNDLSIKNKNNLFNPSSSIIFTNNEGNSNRINNNNNNNNNKNNNIKVNIINKVSDNLDNKKNKKINQIKEINIINNKYDNRNKIYNINNNGIKKIFKIINNNTNIDNNINIRLNLKSSNHSNNNSIIHTSRNNNITDININNNSNNNINNNINNKIKKSFILSNKQSNNINDINNNNNNNNNNSNNSNINKIKNYIINSNIDKNVKNNHINSERKNHIHIISNIGNISTNIKKVNSKRNKDIHIIKNYKSDIIELNRKFLNHSMTVIDNDIQNIKTEKPSSKNILGNKPFHSDDYNIIDLIGEGTYGKIYLVKNTKTNEIFALKQLSIKNKDDANKQKKEFEFIMKLTEENPDLNIIKILGIEIKQLDKFNTVLYILMEAGKSDWEKEVYRRNLIQNYYSEEELIDILTSLVKTFAYLQEKGISHRDVKPQNILFFEKNKNIKKDLYKITDFGEAKINRNKKYVFMNHFEKNTSKQTLRGTELYMSPLLFNALKNKGEIDIQHNPYKSDVYSLGLCILLAARLSYIPLYEIREIKDMDKTKRIIEGYLYKLYSKKFINLLLYMLQINEKFRPDFIELNSSILNHYLN